MIENEELRSPRSLRAQKSLDSNNELDEKATFYLILLRLALFYPLTKSPIWYKV